MRCLYGPQKLAEEGKVMCMEILPGSRIADSILEAISLSERMEIAVRIDFNDVQITVMGDSDAGLIRRDWSRAMEGCIEKRVGPYPRADLTDAECAHDARVRAENEHRREVERRKYEAERDADRKRLAEELKTAPDTMSLRDPDAWAQAVRNNQSPYGSAAIRFAEHWARLMEARMADGETLEECVDGTAGLAMKPEGLTGFQYGCAVSILAHVWEHGEALRQWHNLRTQIRTEGERANREGGVLNPALLSLERKP